MVQTKENKMELEDIQAEERYEAIDDLTNDLLVEIAEFINFKGGSGEELINYIASREGIGDIMDGLHIAMPWDYGLETKGESK